MPNRSPAPADAAAPAGRGQPSARGLHLVMVTVHTSPIAAPGSADAGGMNVVIAETARELGRMGHRVSLVTRRDDPSLPAEDEVSPLVTVHYLDAGPAQTVAKSDAESLIDPFREALDTWLDAHPDVDVIHSHHWFSGVAALEPARRRGIPHIQSFHSVAAPVGAPLSEGEQPESEGRIDGERLAANGSDAVITVSKAEAGTIERRYQVPPERLAVVYPGVDHQVFRPRQADEQAPEHIRAHQPYLLYPARLHPLKAQDYAIDVLAAMPADTHLVLAGAVSKDTEAYRDELLARAAEKGVAERVHFPGALDRQQLGEWMRHALALLNPSQSETFGLVNVEAAASGIPTIATDVPGLNESVRGGVSGLVMPARDPDDWARALTALTGEHLRDLQASAARFSERFSWQDVATGWLDVYAAHGVQAHPAPGCDDHERR